MKTGSKELRKRLPHGAIKQIADMNGISWVWAYRVITGRETGNDKIIDDALIIAENNDNLKSLLWMNSEK